MKEKFVLLLLLVAALAPLSARGRAESGGVEAGPSVYLVFAAREEPDPLFVERWHLPLAAAAYAWTAFSAGNGEVTLREAGGLRILSKRPILREETGGILVVGWSLSASGYDAVPGTPRRILEVRFDYDRRPGQGPLIQPARRALLEGIRADGGTSGFVRLEELAYLGGGRFRARVAVR